VRDAPSLQVLRLARLAIAAGADGLVCSPEEVALLRGSLDSRVKLVVPGIRLSRTAEDDQKRIMTPKQAIAAGADWIVVGRPITRAANVAEAAAEMAAAIA